MRCKIIFRDLPLNEVVAMDPVIQSVLELLRTWRIELLLFAIILLLLSVFVL